MKACTMGEAGVKLSSLGRIEGQDINFADPVINIASASAARCFGRRHGRSHVAGAGSDPKARGSRGWSMRLAPIATAEITDTREEATR